MKVFELFEDGEISPSKRDFGGTVRAIRKTRPRTGAVDVGGGAFGRVFNQPKRVNSVLKVGVPAEGEYSEDGYVPFIEKIMHLDNPYFPKVDELKKFKASSGENYFTVRMEKLHPLSDLRTEEVQAIWGRIFGHPLDDNEVVELTKKLIPLPTQRKHFGDKVWIAAIAEFVENCVEEPANMKGVEDFQFKQATAMLHMMFKDGFMTDLHHENIMFRRTPYGPQLVFTDPFSYGNTNKSDDYE